MKQQIFPLEKLIQENLLSSLLQTHEILHNWESLFSTGRSS